MIKLIIKSRLLPLNVDSVFDFKLESCESVLQDAKTLIRKEWDIVENSVNFWKCERSYHWPSTHAHVWINAGRFLRHRCYVIIYFYYCLFCPRSILFYTLNSTLYFVKSELKMTEELLKHVFKKCRLIYQNANETE